MSVFVGSLNNFTRSQSGFRRESPVIRQCDHMLQYADSVTMLSKIFPNDVNLLNTMNAGIITSYIAKQTEGINIRHKSDVVEISTCQLDSGYIRDCSDVIQKAKVLVHNNDATCSLEDMKLLHDTAGPSIFIGPTHEQAMLNIPDVYLEWNVSNLNKTAIDLLSLGCKNIILGNESNAIFKNAKTQLMKNINSPKDAFIAGFSHNLILTNGMLPEAFEMTCDS